MNMKNLILMWLIASVLISGCQQKTENGSKTLDDPQQECANVNGMWKMFSDGCVDSCFKARSKEPVFCTLAITDGCDCGADRCWNGKTCEAN